MGSQFRVLGVGEWYGVWVRGVGGECKKNFENFSKSFGKLFGDPKTENQYCDTTKQYFDKWSMG